MTGAKREYLPPNKACKIYERDSVWPGLDPKPASGVEDRLSSAGLSMGRTALGQE